MPDAQELPAELAAQYNAQFDAAQACLERILRFHERPTGWFGFFGRRRARRGIEHLITCLEIVPDAWQCMWLIGKAYQAMDEHEAALAWFEKAHALEKGNPDVPREASLCCLALGLADKAKALAEDALARDPQNAGLISNLALALVLTGDLDGAALKAGAAVKAAPDDPVCAHVLRYVAQVQAGELPKPDKIAPQG